MPEKKTYQEFSSAVKEKYPEYKDIDDKELALKIIDKHPEYKEQVSFEDKTSPTSDAKKKYIDYSDGYLIIRIKIGQRNPFGAFKRFLSSYGFRNPFYKKQAISDYTGKD